MPPDQISDLARSLIAGYLCVLAPGQAWWRGRLSAVPRLWAQALLSVLVTTAVASSLAALETFSLALVVLCCAVVTFAGFLYQLLFRGRADDVVPWHDRIGPLVFVAALAAYWPPYPTFLAAADSSAYLHTGVSLARTGKLALEDELGPKLDPAARYSFFDSMSQVLGGGGPPYRRMPGALLIHDIEDARAWPAFFPVPSVWAALATEIAGARAAPAYATFFAALAVWSTFVLARGWLSLPWALLAALLVACNGATYYFAHFAMSEPLAWYFAWAGMAAIAAYDREGGRGDAALAASAFGAALLTRIDFAIFLVGAAALLPALRKRGGATVEDAHAQHRSLALPLPPVFAAVLAGWTLLTAAQLAWIPGSYASPLADSVRNIGVVWLFARIHYAVALAAALIVAATGMVAAAWRFGAGNALRAAVVIGFLVLHAAVSSFLPTRTPVWLSLYLGWPTLIAALAGAVVIWRRRDELPGASWFLALLAATALVLLYNPHVHPGVPWGLRRFIPLMLPGVLLLAVAAASQAWNRSRMLGLAVAVAIVIGVADGARTVWGKPFFGDAPQQLDALEAALPKDGVVIINRTLSAQMIGPALWMLYGRNNLSVYPDTTVAGRQQIATAVHTFKDRPVYFVTGGIGQPQRVPFVRGSLVARTRIHLLLLEPTVVRRPEKSERYLEPIAIYKLEPSMNGKGEPIR